MAAEIFPSMGIPPLRAPVRSAAFSGFGADENVFALSSGYPVSVSILRYRTPDALCTVCVLRVRAGVSDQ